jgi:hypothetical protein
LFTLITQSGSQKMIAAAGRYSDFSYFWENLGLLPLVALAGFMIMSVKQRLSVLPFICLFLAVCAYALFEHRGFDQKFFSFLVVGVNILGAIAVTWLWRRRDVFIRILALGILFILTVSGVVDLMAIKNEFAFPLIDGKTASVISWIRHNTPREAVFVSYSDIIDPVVLAGRKNFFGFFRNIVRPDRSEIVRDIYRGDKLLAARHRIDYVLVPRVIKNDFPYSVDEDQLRAIFSVVFESHTYIILRVDRVVLE